MARTAYTDLIRQVALSCELPFDMLEAQVLTESGGNPWAFRYEDAFFQRYIAHNSNALGAKFGPFAACSCGLMQIMVETALEIGFTDRPEHLFEPRVGLVWGARQMARLLKWSNGEYRQALAAYNTGRGNWQSSAGTLYVNRVLSELAA
jgi:hypothetical protein